MTIEGEDGIVEIVRHRYNALSDRYRAARSARQRYAEVMAREPQGRFLGLPYNWRRPIRDGAGKKSARDPDDRRILTPKNYGWGYGINFAALKRRFTRR